MKSVLVFVFLLANIAAFSQTESKFNKENDVKSIEVTGRAELEVIPDEIYLSIKLKEREEKKVKITIEKQENDLKEALKGINIPLDKLSLSDIDADYIRVRWQKKDLIAQSKYVLKLENASEVAKVFKALDQLKINDAYIARVSHSKIEEYRKEIKIMAIKAAKEKADYLLLAIGEERGSALKVKEKIPSKNTNAYSNVRREREDAFAYSEFVSIKDKEKPLMFKKIKLKAGVFVVFEIK